ncbi:hypothetical protein O1W68_11845 [Rhodococcus sp. H36-A4]|uniref:hypothetical protein n=1 Tax=Rhodococcus sp. H36-A4 TaxID=3004353 RepID=UPI0022AE77C2|nr:hypothetical protein [Rhodococcus sp. H36-A4]MCZ4078637.1 hypothetical protein [Rhodococcus sp. H36-A4]
MLNRSEARFSGSLAWLLAGLDSTTIFIFKKGMFTIAKYTEEERRTFAELAGDTGLAKAKRELGYPESWATGKKWCEEFGVVIELDALKSKAAQYNSFYEETELRIAQQDLLSRSLELLENRGLTPVELDKVASAMKKATDSIQALRGKATSFTAKEDSLESDALKMFDKYQKTKVDDSTNGAS